MKEIQWTPYKVLVANIAPTPDNFKLKTELGMQRLQASLKRFGRAGTAVCNWKKGMGNLKSLVLIDGNSRVEKAKEKGDKYMYVSLPDRKLSPKDFSDMTKIFDYAVAGDVDIDRINKDKGSTKKFFEEFQMEVPLHLLNNIGRKGKHDIVASKLDYPQDVKDAVSSGANIVMVNLFFNAKQEAEFRKLEEKLMKRFKTKSTTETVLKSLRHIK